MALDSEKSFKDENTGDASLEPAICGEVEFGDRHDTIPEMPRFVFPEDENVDLKMLKRDLEIAKSFERQLPWEKGFEDHEPQGDVGKEISQTRKSYKKALLLMLAAFFVAGGGIALNYETKQDISIQLPKNEKKENNKKVYSEAELSEKYLSGELPFLSLNEEDDFGFELIYKLRYLGHFSSVENFKNWFLELSDEARRRENELILDSLEYFSGIEHFESLDLEIQREIALSFRKNLQ